MAAIPLEKDEIFYPESDGEPMAESEVHLRQAEERLLALEQEIARLRERA